MDAQTEALKYSLEHELDNHAIACAMAKEQPALFVELSGVDLDMLAAAFLKESPEYFLRLAKIQKGKLERLGEIKTFMTAGNMVGAIKVLRETHGLGLKEAKDIVVALRDKLQLLGKLPHTPTTGNLVVTLPLDKSIASIYDALLEAW